MGKDNFKKKLSYLWPITETISSKFSGELKVGWVNGKKVINTQQANYSYGGLQKVLNAGLDKISLDNVKSVLALGMGGCCIVDSLRSRYFYSGSITGVELDPVIFDLSKKVFGIHKDKGVRLIQGDAEKFVADCTDAFDLIVIDLFIDIEVPEVFYRKEFWLQVERLLTKNGVVLFNAGIKWEKARKNKFLASVGPLFSSYQVYKAEVNNTLIVFEKE